MHHLLIEYGRNQPTQPKLINARSLAEQRFPRSTNQIQPFKIISKGYWFESSRGSKMTSSDNAVRAAVCT
jgi:hypothetical protein